MEDRHDLVPAMEAATVEDGVRLWWFGGPSYAIRTPETTVYVDPYYGATGANPADGFIRAIPDVFFPQDVTRADLILSTHDHADHCDRATLEALCARTEARIAAAPSSARMMADWDFTAGRVDVTPPGTANTYGDVTLTSFPSRDWSDPGAVTYVLRARGKAIFIGGDTLYAQEAFAAAAKDGPIDLAILALGRNRRDLIDQQLYVTPEEVAQAARDLGARRVLPIHWDIWEAWQEDPHLVAPHLAGSGIELIILAQGDSLTV
jgi:L-ascorbate 6-phosphate lactonase